MNLRNISLLLITACLFWSCKTKNDISYMQNIDQIAIDASKRNAKLNVQVGDELKIVVSGIDADVVSPFNQNYSSSRVANYNNAASNLPNTPDRSVEPSYIVDTEGMINFPILGKVPAVDKSIEEIQADLEQKISRYVKNPTVNVQLGNFKVTMLGEVAKPGDYLIPSGKATLLSALGMAGDATIYGLRTNVLLVRNENGEISQHRVDITSADFINSPYYHLKQNDVIYISPNKTKQSASIFGQQTGVFISITSILVTIIALIIRK